MMDKQQFLKDSARQLNRVLHNSEKSQADLQSEDLQGKLRELERSEIVDQSNADSLLEMAKHFASMDRRTFTSVHVEMLDMQLEQAKS